MPRETAAQRNEREEKAKEEKERAKSEISVSTRTIIKFQGTRYEDEGDYGEYTAIFDADTDKVLIEAPCGEERYFKRSALAKLVEALV